MPAIAVGAAIYGGATIATVGITAMSTMAAISAVGAIAAGVGTVTGNKDLVKIGAIAGLAGGIGAYAQGQGWMPVDDVADVAAATESASAVSAPTATEGLAPNPTAPSYQPPTTDESQVMNGTWDQTQTPPVVQDAPPSGLVNSNTNDINGLDLTPTQSAAVQAGNNANKPPVTSKSIFDVLKGVGETLSANKELASLGLHFVGGMFDKKKEAEANLANSNVEYNNSRIVGNQLNQDQQRQQMANANAIPDLTALKIKQGSVYGNTTPPVYTAPRIGLMNSTGR
jgi:hypothetical protein